MQEYRTPLLGTDRRGRPCTASLNLVVPILSILAAFNGSGPVIIVRYSPLFGPATPDRLSDHGGGVRFTPICSRSDRHAAGPCLGFGCAAAYIMRDSQSEALYGYVHDLSVRDDLG
jgi:hypothetical protein